MEGVRRIWVNKAKSFEEAAAFDREYDERLSPEERLETVQMLREMHFAQSGMVIGENGKRLRRVLNVVQPA